MDCQSHSDSVVQEPCARREADTDAAWKEEGAGQPGMRDSELGTAQRCRWAMGESTNRDPASHRQCEHGPARPVGPAPEREVQSSGRRSGTIVTSGEGRLLK